MLSPEKLQLNNGHDFSMPSVSLPEKNGHFVKKDAPCLAQFENTCEFRDIQSKLACYLDEAKTQEEKEKIYQEFAGFSFETLAFQYLRADLGEFTTMLTPQETDDYFISHFPDHEIREFPFGKKGISGVVVPDSLVMDSGDIIYHVEFSLHQGGDYFYHKYDGFTHNRWDKAFAGAYEGARLLFGVPRSFSHEVKEYLEMIYGSDIEMYFLPFTHKEFRNQIFSAISHL